MGWSWLLGFNGFRRADRKPHAAQCRVDESKSKGPTQARTPAHLRTASNTPICHWLVLGASDQWWSRGKSQEATVQDEPTFGVRAGQRVNHQLDRNRQQRPTTRLPTSQQLGLAINSCNPSKATPISVFVRRSARLRLFPSGSIFHFGQAQRSYKEKKRRWGNLLRPTYPTDIYLDCLRFPSCSPPREDGHRAQVTFEQVVQEYISSPTFGPVCGWRSRKEGGGNREDTEDQ